MDLVPSLTVVVERGFFSHEMEWQDALVQLASLLPALPGLQVQARSKKSRTDREWAATNLLLSPRLRLNAALRETTAQGYPFVHHPERDCPGSPVSHSFGASAHSLLAARKAERAGAQYVQFGPVFPPRSKPGAGLGLGPLRQVAAALSIPVIAVGGMTPERAAQCIGAGAGGVACISHVLQAKDRQAAAAELLDAMAAGPTGRS